MIIAKPFTEPKTHSDGRDFLFVLRKVTVTANIVTVTAYRFNTSKITAISARYISISGKYPTNHIKAKFEPFPAVFQRYISLLATIPLQYIPKSRICNIFRLFFKMGKHRVRLSADHSLSGEPELPFGSISAEKAGIILMQVKVRATFRRPNGLQRRAKPTVKP